jgi:hypothetical protein
MIQWRNCGCDNRKANDLKKKFTLNYWKALLILKAISTLHSRTHLVQVSTRANVTCIVNKSTLAPKILRGLRCAAPSCSYIPSLYSKLWKHQRYSPRLDDISALLPGCSADSTTLLYLPLLRIVQQFHSECRVTEESTVTPPEISKSPVFNPTPRTKSLGQQRARQFSWHLALEDHRIHLS